MPGDPVRQAWMSAIEQINARNRQQYTTLPDGSILPGGQCVWLKLPLATGGLSSQRAKAMDPGEMWTYDPNPALRLLDEEE